MKPNQIAKMVHYYRKKSGLTQNELARLANVGKTSIFDIEKGKETVQLNTLLRVLDILNIKLKLEPPLGQSSGEFE